MFEIKDIIEMEDGSVELDLKYDRDFTDKIKKQYGWKKLTQKRLEWFINKCLMEYIETGQKDLSKLKYPNE